MRVLLLLRGSPGCGKSTWIKENGLERYTLSADEIRLMCSSPAMNVSGNQYINPDSDHIVWNFLFKVLENRMQHGDFTVIDATNSKTSEMNKYKDLCDNYRYRIYCVDFTDIPIEVVKERNAAREPLKRVPESAIDKMYARFETQKIPAGITVIKPNELDKIWYKKTNLSEYNKVHIIGDIHGCYTALNEYIGDGIKDDEYYIFVGDYIDRGIENAEVIKFLLSIYTKKNVFLIEGNHERWLWIWANDGVAPSKEFELHTRGQLENGGVDKKEVRKLYRKFGQCAYFDYNGKTHLVTHGGLSTIPENLTLISTEQMIKGVGNYSDAEIVDNMFEANSGVNFYQIHGHRNPKHTPVKVGERCYNLEGKVEFGGDLRCIELCRGEEPKTFEIHNTVFKMIDGIENTNSDSIKSVGDTIIALRQSKYIQEKQYGNISSFNFTKTAFYDKAWDEQTIRARGLYINIPKQKVVARAYNKFFNINERSDTKLDMLQYRMKFPVTAYVKENGFLGIVSYNDEDNSLFITTKSSPEGDFAKWLKEMFYEKYSAETIENIKKFSKENNVSFVFECVDIKNDPHVIDYDESNLYLLDIVCNDMNFKKVDYEQVKNFAEANGMTCKEKAIEIATWQEFYDWYYEVVSEEYKYNGRDIEGFVIEDSNGFMVKLKLAYYNFWKFMRGISHEVIRRGYADRKRLSGLLTPLANSYYGWIRDLRATYDKESAAEIPTDIVTLRKMFYESDSGREFKVV